MRRLRGLAGLAIVALLSCVALLLAPMAGAQKSEERLVVRSIDGRDREAVQITFLWTGGDDALGRLVLRENGEQRKLSKVESFRATGQTLRTVFVVDTSNTMGTTSALTKVKEGLSKITSDLAPGDQIAVVSYNDRVSVETDFTANAAQVDRVLDELISPADSGSAVNDALVTASSLLSGTETQQPNVVLITDGADDASTASQTEAQAALIPTGAALYTLAIGEDVGSVDSIADRVGGELRTTDVNGAGDALVQLYGRVGNQFSIQYASNAEAGQVDVSMTVGEAVAEASYVSGGRVTGAATAVVSEAEGAFGPSWLRGTLGGTLGLVLIGLAVGLCAYSVVSLMGRSEDGLQAMLRPYSDGPVTEDDNEGALAQTAILQRAVEMTEDFAERQGFLVKVERALERADLPLRAAEAIFFSVVIGAVVTILGFFLKGPMIGLVVMVIAMMLPFAAINFLAERRKKAFQGQLPDTLQLLAGSLRAGYSLMQGVEAVSKEVEDPMGKELRRVITEARLGREIEDAMDAMAERMGSADFEWAVMAIRIQREVGGNLSELLLTVADTMVQRDRLRRDVASLTAEGKMSAIILGLLPIGLGGFMWMSNPGYMAPLGSTGMGQALLLIALVSGLIGFAWMKKIINVEI